MISTRCIEEEELSMNFFQGGQKHTIFLENTKKGTVFIEKSQKNILFRPVKGE
jgi:hypothetical protein